MVFSIVLRVAALAEAFVGNLSASRCGSAIGMLPRFEELGVQMLEYDDSVVDLVVLPS